MLDEFEDPSPVVRDPNEIRRDHYGRYMLPEINTAAARASDDEAPWTRVTTFASTLGDTTNLSMWSQRLVAKGMATREDLRLAAFAASLDDKATLNEIVMAAKELSGGPAAARKGTALHSFTEYRDKGESDDMIDAEFIPHLDAYSDALKTHGVEIMPEYIERVVAWGKYRVAGQFDRIVMWKGKPTVFDLKTGRDLSYGWQKIAVQLLCYASADGIWNPREWRWEPMPDGLRTDIALVAHLPSGGSAECTLWEIDLLPAVEAVRISYEARDWLKTRGLATKLKPSVEGTYEMTVMQTAEPVEKPKRRSPRKKAEPVVEVLEGAALDAEVAASHPTTPAEATPTIKDGDWPWPWAQPEKTLTPDEAAADLYERLDARIEAERLERELLVEVTTTEDEIVADISLVSEDDDPFADLPVEIDLDHAVTPEEKYAALIRGAATPAELSTIRREAMEEDAWSDTLLKMGMERLADLKK